MSTPNKGPETSETVEKEKAPQQQAPQPQAAESKDSAEKTPQLELEVAGECNNPKGNYVGLNAKQRADLGVENGETVDIFNKNGKHEGTYIVGPGKTEYIGTKKFTINGKEAGTHLIARKAVNSPETVTKFELSHSIENAPEGLNDGEKEKYKNKTKQRVEKITKRFPDVDSEEFITIPGAILGQMTGEKAHKSTTGPTAGSLVHNISKGKIRIGGKEFEMVIVPAGQNIGLTSKAAQKLGIPPELKELQIRVEDGILVIN